MTPETEVRLTEARTRGDLTRDHRVLVGGQQNGVPEIGTDPAETDIPRLHLTIVGTGIIETASETGLVIRNRNALAPGEPRRKSPMSR